MAAVVVADAAAVVAVEAISITMVLDAAMLIVVLPISILTILLFRRWGVSL